MKSILKLLSFEQLKQLEIKRLRSERTVNESEDCDLQIRLTHDGKGMECLDFRFFDCEFIRKGALVAVLPTVEGLYLRCTNKADDSTRRLSFEGYKISSGALKVRISSASCEDFETLARLYANSDYLLVPATDEYFAAIEI